MKRAGIIHALFIAHKGCCLLFLMMQFFKISVFYALLSFSIEKDLDVFYLNENLALSSSEKEMSAFFDFFKDAGPELIPFFLSPMKKKKETYILPLQGVIESNIPYLEARAILNYKKEAIPYLVKEILIMPDENISEKNYLFVINQLLCGACEDASFSFDEKNKWLAFEPKKNVKHFLSNFPLVLKPVLPTSALIAHIEKRLGLSPEMHWIFPRLK